MRLEWRPRARTCRKGTIALGRYSTKRTEYVQMAECGLLSALVMCNVTVCSRCKLVCHSSILSLHWCTVSHRWAKVLKGTDPAGAIHNCTSKIEGSTWYPIMYMYIFRTDSRTIRQVWMAQRRSLAFIDIWEESNGTIILSTDEMRTTGNWYDKVLARLAHS